MLTPLDRVRRDLKERGVPMAMGSLVSFIERAADRLEDPRPRAARSARRLIRALQRERISVRAEALEDPGEVGLHGHAGGRRWQVAGGRWR